MSTFHEAMSRVIDDVKSVSVSLIITALSILLGSQPSPPKFHVSCARGIVEFTASPAGEVLTKQ